MQLLSVHTMSLRNLFTSALLLLLKFNVGAFAYYTNCDQTFNINAGVSYLQSPNYPENYKAGTSCRYKYIAPLDNYIELSCDINIYSTSAGCTTDNLYLDIEGDKQMRSSENFCGTRSFKRQSLFRSLVISHTSDGSNSGKYNCKLTAKPQACDCGWYTSPRIANGQEATANEYPSMAALKNLDTQRVYCGASIISHYYLLSSGSCGGMVTHTSDMVAIVGTNDLDNPTNSKYYAQYSIQNILVHEEYQSNPTTVNDIAILKTYQAIDWSRGVGPVCLPPPTTNDDFQYQTVKVAGWGSTSFAGSSSSTLRKAELMIVSKADCQKEYKDINDGQVCTLDYSGNSREPCQYDSGGPLFFVSTRQHMLGIISADTNCATSNYPMSYNTRISYYNDWILSNIDYSNCAVLQLPRIPVVSSILDIINKILT